MCHGAAYGRHGLAVRAASLPMLLKRRSEMSAARGTGAHASREQAFTSAESKQAAAMNIKRRGKQRPWYLCNVWLHASVRRRHLVPGQRFKVAHMLILDHLRPKAKEHLRSGCEGGRGEAIAEGHSRDENEAGHGRLHMGNLQSLARPFQPATSPAASWSSMTRRGPHI